MTIGSLRWRPARPAASPTSWVVVTNSTSIPTSTPSSSVTRAALSKWHRWLTKTQSAKSTRLVVKVQCAQTSDPRTCMPTAA
jgi:hypothetical protein